MSAIPKDRRTARGFALCGCGVREGVPACLTECSHRPTLLLLPPGQADALERADVAAADAAAATAAAAAAAAAAACCHAAPRIAAPRLFPPS